jgi:hypothetical protein
VFGSDVLPLCVGAFDGMVADPVVLRNAPAIISAGRRIANMERSVIWNQGRACCIVLPG